MASLNFLYQQDYPQTAVSLKKAILICNPAAGCSYLRHKPDVQEATAILRRAGIEATLSFTSCAGNARLLAQEAVQARPELIIVWGGDGTINEVINGIGCSQAPLAILPAGTANIIGKELGIPNSPLDAAQELPNWQPHRIALGRALWGEPRQERYFVAVAGVGFDARIISRLNLASKWKLGVVRYGLEAFHQLLQYDFPQFECSIKDVSVSTTFAVVQRSTRYAGWLHLARSAGLRGQRLACCCFHGRHRTRYLLYALGVLARCHHRLPDVTLLEGDPITCCRRDSETPIQFELDGELAGEIPVTFEIVPDALTLLAPPRFCRSSPDFPARLPRSA